MHRFAKDARGSVSILAAFCFSTFMVISFLIIQGSQLFMLRLKEQRTADFASLAAGGVPNAIANNAPSEAARLAAQQIVRINGFDDSKMQISAAEGASLIKVRLSHKHAFATGAFAYGGGSAEINSHAMARPVVSVPGCVVAHKDLIVVAPRASLSGPACAAMARSGFVVNLASVALKSVAVGISRDAEARMIWAPTSLQPDRNEFGYRSEVADTLLTDPTIGGIRIALQAMARWPHPDELPVTAQRGSNPRGGADVYAFNREVFIGPQDRIGSISARNATLRFASIRDDGDPNCQSPTTVAGSVRLESQNNLVFGSGCYVFNGDFVQKDTMVSSLGLERMDTKARFIFNGRLGATNSGGLSLPAATYSINSGLNLESGGSIRFGDGPKVIAGMIFNPSGLIALGNGPHYVSARLWQGTATLEFGNGPTYVYDSNFVNGAAGTLVFGKGPVYLRNTTLNNGGISGRGEAAVMFKGGDIHVWRSAIMLNAMSMAHFAPGTLQLHESTFRMNGKLVSFEGVRVLMRDSIFSFTGDRFTAIESTFAQRGGSTELSGSQITMSSPSQAGHPYAYRDLLFVKSAGDLRINAANGQGRFSGLLYAPDGKVEFTRGDFRPDASRCLTVIGQSVELGMGVNLSVAPCPAFALPGGVGSRARLVGG